MQSLLDRIRELMKQYGINAKQLTTELGISNSSFTDWGKGKAKPSLDAVVKISDYFNVSIDYLVHGSEFAKAQNYTVAKILEFSNPMDEELLDKFHRLPPELQGKLLGYADGMLATTPKTEEEQLKLSV